MRQNTEMIGSFPVRPAVAAVLAAALAVPLGAQETEGPLTPAGRLRLEVQSTFLSWDARFGDRPGGEPLGTHLTDATGSVLFPGVANLEAHLRELLADPGYEARVGSARTEVSASRIRLPIRLDLGITDWLTLGVTVPLVQNRTEVAFAFRADTATATLGVNPAVTRTDDVLAFTQELQGRVQAASARADELCAVEPGSPECAAARQVAESGDRLFSGFVTGYGASPFFPLEASPAAGELRHRVEAFNEGLGSLDLAPLGRQPLFPSERTTREDLDALLADPVVGILMAPPGDRVGLWEMGDVELHVALRLLERAARPSPEGSPPLTYQLGGGLLVRLPTGGRDDPDVLLDLPAGDGQTDLEGRVFGNVRSGRFGLWSDLRYGVQRPRTLLRRVGPRELVLIPRPNLATVEWTPGDYVQLELVPRYHFTDELALTAGYRLFDKGQDAFARLSPPPGGEGLAPIPAPPLFTDAALLAAGTEETLHELGAGLVFSTLEAWRAGRTSLPFEVRFAMRWGLAGSGQAPKGFRAAVGLRFFRRIWGS